MLKIKVEKDNNQYKNILIKGHALYDNKGKDIVCASVSSIVITTVNAIEMIDNSVIKYKLNDNLEIEVLKSDEIVNKLLDNMINLLEQLMYDYPKNIKFI
jgi:uncharacterized protein YsxB (DUF464 family)